ncbi:hypothetical protein [Nocardia cerradoensis]|uniref:Uncharacterized protein n=1 Tax=Nocardia cerradoensis TaxID=85688 RepID=A0A231GY83_9NOCA|nr:hypothetical protein [Nocardia cerradoensis]NKY43310.1 hypothetical protein [Nocardia cerradoensis]OXR41584.1 hypothetical protein B7C42_06225 [Nocardia cerradoensis]
MSEPENSAACGAALDTQLRLFCHLMLGSADAADRMMRQIYRHAPDHHDDQRNRHSERARLFGIAADLCGVRNCSFH